MGDVLGRSKTFPDGRIVYVGTDKERPDTRFIGFRSLKGDDMNLSLSAEALEALAELLSNPLAGMPLARHPFKSEWRLVLDYDEAK